MEKREKTGGREKGTPNKLTSELRAVLKDVIFNELEQLPNYLDSLDYEKRLAVVLKLFPYVLPKVTVVADNRGEPDEFSLGLWS